MTEAELKGKRFVALLGATKESSLTFNDRMVHSYLVYQAKYNSSSRVNWIAFGTGLKWETVQASLNRLVSYNLATFQEGVYDAIEPCGELWSWFPLKKNADTQKWFRRFPYTKVYLPSKSSPLTDKQNAIFWTLANLSDDQGICKAVSTRGMARLLSITPQTFANALDVLRDQRLIRRSQKGSAVLSVQVFAMPLDFVMGKENRPIADIKVEEIVWEDELPVVQPESVNQVVEVVESTPKSMQDFFDQMGINWKA